MIILPSGILIEQGTYTPTATGIANMGAASPAGVAGALWTRIGNVVTVRGQFTAQASVTLTLTTITLDVPVATANFPGLNSAPGLLASTGVNGAGRIHSTNAAQTVTCSWSPTATSNSTYSFRFDYTIQ